MKLKIKLFADWTKKNWKKIAITILLVTIVAAAYSPAPKVISQRMNQYEAQTIEKINNFDYPWYKSVNAPYILPTVAIDKIKNNSLESARFVSYLFAILSSIMFFVLLNRWFNTKIAIIGSILFTTNSLVISSSHQALPLSLTMFLLIAILSFLNWFVRTKDNSFISFLFLVISLAISAYMPFLFLITIAISIFLAISYKQKIKRLNILQILSAIIIYLLIISPLIFSLFSSPGQIKELIGLNNSFIGFESYLLNIFKVLLSIGVYSQAFPSLYLGNLPILEAFSAAFLLLGIFYFANRIKYKKNLVILVIFLLIVLLISLSNQFQLYVTALLPIIFLLTTIGVMEIIKIWFTYFPRNPIARSIGIFLISLSIGLISYYQVNRYYVAWANSPETNSAYMIEYKKN